MQQQYLLKDPYNTYKQQGVLTAGPIELIIMLYNGLRKNLVLAQRDISQKHDTESAHNHLIKSQNIVNELLNSLDMSFSISRDLMAIYDYLLHQLVKINVSKQAEEIGPLLEIIDALREAWQQVGDQNKGGLYVKED